MPTVSKILAYVLSGLRDNNIAFSDLQRLLDCQCVKEIINIQRKCNNAYHNSKYETLF